MKRFFAGWLLVSAALLYGQSDNIIHVKDFPGGDVGTKVALAQLTCNPNTAIPCLLVIDASLATWQAGTLPTLCAQCHLADYRSGFPSGGGSMTWPAAAGVAIYAGGNAWASSYNTVCNGAGAALTWTGSTFGCNVSIQAVALATTSQCSADSAPTGISTSGGPENCTAYVPNTTPTISSLAFPSQINWQGSTYESNALSGVMLGDVHAGSTFIEGIARTYATAPFTFDVQFAAQPQGNFVMGIGVASSLTGALEEMEYHVPTQNGTTAEFDVQDWNTPSSFNGFATGCSSTFAAPFYGSVWLRLQDDGTNLKWFYSTDGGNWFNQCSITKSSDFLHGTGFNYLVITWSSWAANMQTVVQTFRLTNP